MRRSSARLRAGVFAVLLPLLLLPRAGAAQPERSALATEVISGDELREMGVFRLGDLLQYVSGARAGTVDGFSGHAVLAGLGLPGTAAWRIMVDGRPVDTGLWDEPNLNLLPVALEEIRSVEVVTVPGLYEGAFSDGGIIHVRTGAGRAISASVAVQNETGDPGPFSQVEGERRPNVDSNGPDLSLTGHIRTGQYKWEIGGVRRIHHPTDPALLDRIAAAYYTPELAGRALRIALSGVRLSGGFTGSRGAFESSGWATRVRDFVYLPALGREWPLRQSGVRLSGGGRWAMQGDTRLKVSGTYARREAEVRGAGLGLPLDWSSDRARLNARVEQRRPSFEITVGASGDVERAVAPSNGLDAAVRGVGRAFAEWRSERFRPLLAAGGAVTAGRSGAGGKAYGHVGVERARHRTDIHLAAVQTLPEERTDLAYWMRRGFTLGDAARTRFNTGAGRERYFSADVGWAWYPRTWEVKVRGFYRHYADAVFLDRRLAYRHPAFVVEERAYRSARGATAGASIRARMSLDRGPERPMDLRLEYGLLGAVAGDETFRDAWAAVPRHSVHGALSSPLGGSLTIRTDVWVRSGSYWADFREAERQTSGAYSPVAPEHVRWDLALYKGFDGGRVQASLAFENLLNRTIRYHPAGASFGLAVRGRLAVGF